MSSPNKGSEKETILITCASGLVGRATICSLLDEKNSQLNIRALVREEDLDLMKDCANHPNLKLVKGNLENVQLLDEVLDGVSRALLVCPNVPNQHQLEKNFIQAAVKRKLDLLVKVSILSPMSMVSTDSRVSFVRQHAEVEEYLRTNFKNFVILRPNFFFEDICWFKEEIMKDHSISVPCPTVPATMVAVEDIGKIAASILIDKSKGSKLIGKSLDICGPESVSFDEICRRLSKRLSQDIRVKEIDSDTLVERLKKIDHLSEEMRKGLKPIFDNYWSKGAFNCQGNPELPVVPSVTLDQWLDKHITEFQYQSR